MQPRGLKARACEMGVCEERIDATMDEDDVKGALIAVILEHNAQTKPDGLQQYLDLFVSKHKGVTCNRKSGRWGACIRRNGKNQNLGYFADEEEAAAAYQAAAATIARGEPLPARPARETSSKHKGVYWHKASAKWVAQITHDGKNQSLGYFADEEEAAAVYQAAQATIARGETLPARAARETSSKHKGVSWCKASAKWVAQFRHDGKEHHLGYFADEEQAAAAVREWEASTVPVALPATHALPTSQVAESAQPRGIPSNPACPVHGGGAARMAPAPAAKPPVRPARLKSLWSR
jgi:hypothetical protein